MCKAASPVPVAVGFGVSKPAHVRRHRPRPGPTASSWPRRLLTRSVRTVATLPRLGRSLGTFVARPRPARPNEQVRRPRAGNSGSTGAGTVLGRRLPGLGRHFGLGLPLRARPPLSGSAADFGLGPATSGSGRHLGLGRDFGLWPPRVPTANAASIGLGQPAGSVPLGILELPPQIALEEETIGEAAERAKRGAMRPVVRHEGLAIRPLLEQVLMPKGPERARHLLVHETQRGLHGRDPAGQVPPHPEMARPPGDHLVELDHAGRSPGDRVLAG